MEPADKCCTCICCGMQNGPYKSIDELKEKNAERFTPEMKAIFSKYEKQLVALKPAPEVRALAPPVMPVLAL